MSYRSDINYWYGQLNGAKDNLDRLYERIADVRDALSGLHEQMKQPGISRDERQRCWDEIESIKKARDEISRDIEREKFYKEEAISQIQFYKQHGQH